ncbi:MAG: aspartate aminotransferase family protein [Verrucomicrobia bacterium]|nr:MAG: aspartate aminotransferase family protein [Verrucomicrobiota bacterium]
MAGRRQPTGGRRTRQVLARLRRYESRNILFIDPDGDWPIVWERAADCTVWDADGRSYLDLTAAFGVAAAGHANPRVVAAGQAQMARLLHAMGDVHPHPGKAELARRLSELTFERWSGGATHGKTILCNSGFEAVEAALKTAFLATGRHRVLAFEGAYHGLGYGALTTTHRPFFRSPFRRQLREFARFVPFPLRPEEEAETRRRMDAEQARAPVGAVLVEPIQARGGIRVPPAGFLRELRQWCDRHGALLVLDEIYTGFGRTGRWFACEHEEVTPDLICLGKALTGGFPMSACVGRADLMDAAWPASEGEALHTSTFLGHPVGCAMALAQTTELRRRRLVERSARLGEALLAWLQEIPAPRGVRLDARGRGLMAGLELRDRQGRPATALAVRVVKRLLREGYVFLPEGDAANVIAFTPPLTIPREALRRAVEALGRAIAAEAASETAA